MCDAKCTRKSRPQGGRDFQANKADIYDVIQSRALASITQEHLDKCSAVQLVTAAAILEDKSRLVRGQPTSIHVNALMDVAAMLREHRESGTLARQQDIGAVIQGVGDDE